LLPCKAIVPHGFFDLLDMNEIGLSLVPSAMILLLKIILALCFIINVVPGLINTSSLKIRVSLTFTSPVKIFVGFFFEYH
tara:strand:+ start:46 stop:285 length:240 start_codon:yes stop_codon:yes gene_type:complete